MIDSIGSDKKQFDAKMRGIEQMLQVRYPPQRTHTVEVPATHGCMNSSFPKSV